ncbi:MAG: hypothetical protein K2Q28_10215 [Hyphomicrobium sp.]|nr:hypothetical protein [Hyphomicrobium sp.]
MAVILVANLIWETLQLPLYTIWTTGTARDIAFAVIHCTLGDALIALSALILALVSVGTKNWPDERHNLVLAVTIILGVGYTIFSEWLNIVVRTSWAYSSLMPVVPVIGTGLAPLMQWILIPAIGLTRARRATVAARIQSPRE